MNFDLLDFILWSPVLLAVFFPVGVQYERGGLWQVLLPFYIGAAVLSVTVNLTWFSVAVWELPKKRELTTSERCERLVSAPGWPGFLARAIARFTNRFDPTGPHIALP